MFFFPYILFFYFTFLQPEVCFLFCCFFFFSVRHIVKTHWEIKYFCSSKEGFFDPHHTFYTQHAYYFLYYVGVGTCIMYIIIIYLSKYFLLLHGFTYIFTILWNFFATVFTLNIDLVVSGAFICNIYFIVSFIDTIQSIVSCNEWNPSYMNSGM